MSSPNAPEHKQSGATLSEYGIVIALIGLVAIGALTLLGGNLANLFNRPDLAAGNSAMGRMTGMDFGHGVLNANMNRPAAPAAPSSAAPSGPAAANRRPAVMPPGAAATENARPAVTAGANGHEETVATLYLANRLQELADRAITPDESAYFRELARYSYLMGGAEGYLSDVPGFDDQAHRQRTTGMGMAYSSVMAVTDLRHYGDRMSKLVNNPPAQLRNRPGMKRAQQLAQEVLGIQRTYLSQHAPGLANATAPAAGNNSISMLDAVMDMDTLKRNAHQVLENPQYANNNIITTFQDGRELDHQRP